MAILRINFQSNTDASEQWKVQEVNGEVFTAETITVDVPSWSIVNDDGNFIECNGQVTKVGSSISIRRE
jgi:hypothetical protein